MFFKIINVLLLERFKSNFTPPSHRPGRISSTSGDKNNGLKLDGDWYTHLFYGWGFEFHCFQIRKLSGHGEKNTLFCSGIRLFNRFQREQILEYNFPLGMMFWQIFPVGRGCARLVRNDESLCSCLITPLPSTRSWKQKSTIIEEFAK